MGKVESKRGLVETFRGALRHYHRRCDELRRADADIAEWRTLHYEVVRTFVEAQRLLITQHSITLATLRADVTPAAASRARSVELIRQLDQLAELMRTLMVKIRELEQPASR